jgi:N-acylneuraminate cytidylyltransferase
MRAVALIPARGGSKRLPRKNIVDFHGKPIIAYTIAAAKECGSFERIVVSTEDDAIAKVAQRFGAEVDMRDPALATDAATVDAVCLDFLEREKNATRNWTHMACLYATAPLRTADDINGVMALLGPDCHFAMGVSAYDVQPHIAHKLMEDKRLIPMWPELLKFRASDLPQLRASNGTSYGVECLAFRKHKTFYGPDLRGYDMPRDRAIDIDTADDLTYALWLASRKQND